MYPFPPLNVGKVHKTTTTSPRTSAVVNFRLEAVAMLSRRLIARFGRDRRLCAPDPTLVALAIDCRRQ